MNHCKTLFFDIETAPLPDDMITWPSFRAPANIKDLDKRKEREEANRIKFIEDEVLLKFYSSYVCAIGVKYADNPQVHIKYQTDWRNEKELITWMAEVFETASQNGRGIVAFNAPFDIHYLVQKMRVHEVPIPLFMEPDPKWGIQDKRIIDLRTLLTLGDKYMKGNLDWWCKLYGLPVKEFSGKFFHEMLLQNAQNAFKYLKNDVNNCELLMKRVCSYTGVQRDDPRRGFIRKQ